MTYNFIITENDKIILWFIAIFIYGNIGLLNDVWNKAFPCVPFYS